MTDSEDGPLELPVHCRIGDCSQSPPLIKRNAGLTTHLLRYHNNSVDTATIPSNFFVASNLGLCQICGFLKKMNSQAICRISHSECLLWQPPNFEAPANEFDAEIHSFVSSFIYIYDSYFL